LVGDVAGGDEMAPDSPDAVADIGVETRSQFPALEGADNERVLACVADFVGEDSRLGGIVPALHRGQFIQKDENELPAVLRIPEGYLLLGVLVVVADESTVHSTGPFEPAGRGILYCVVRVAPAHA